MWVQHWTTWREIVTLHRMSATWTYLVLHSFQDLFIGAIVQFYKHKFLLIDADEYAVDYMEKNKHEFPHANIDYILPKLRKLAEEKGDEIRSFFSSYDQSNSGRVRYEPFRYGTHPKSCLISPRGVYMKLSHPLSLLYSHYWISDLTMMRVFNFRFQTF